jgi:hypothetical protein
MATRSPERDDAVRLLRELVKALGDAARRLLG